jgi:hypothetical protein
MCKVNKEMRKLYKEFVKKNGHDPKFAVVTVKFDGEDEEFTDNIKLNGFDPQNTTLDKDDNNVIFYANGIEELCQINKENIADFKITEIYEFTDTI